MATGVARQDTEDRALDVARAARLRGSPRLPGDKSISHRALLLALLAGGESRLRGASAGADVGSTAGIVAALGAEVEGTAGEAGRVDYVVRSPGVGDLRQPERPLDCGNSGTSMRLVAGILAGQPIRAILDGDASLRRRPMGRIIEPLRAMGAWLEGMHGDTPPLIVAGGPKLRAIDWTPPVPSAQVKSAILLAGMRARGTTRVHESVMTRDHTERMLRERGVDVRTLEGPTGWTVEVDGGQIPAMRDQVVPGDPSAAAFWLVAGAIHPDAELTLSDIDVNPSRRAAIDLLRAMGASIDEHAVGGPDAVDEVDDERGDHRDQPGVGEPMASLVVRSSELRAIDVSPAQTAAAIDEIPILALAATQARGRTTIRGAGELRHKESDRITGIVDGLRALGGSATVDGDDIHIDGPTRLRGAAVDGLGDHRLVMTFAIAGLVAEGTTTIHDASSAGISDPAFFDELHEVRA